MGKGQKSNRIEEIQFSLYVFGWDDGKIEMKNSFNFFQKKPWTYIKIKIINK